MILEKKYCKEDRKAMSAASTEPRAVSFSATKSVQSIVSRPVQSPPDMFAFALSVFNSVTPPEQQPVIAVPECVQHVDITDDGAVSYLNALDNTALQALNDIYAEAFREIIADGKITLGDVPCFLRMIGNITSQMNKFHSKNTAMIEVSRLSIVSFMRVSIVVLCQMFLSESATPTVFAIIDMAMDLVQMQVVPIAKKSGLFGWCMPPGST
jgi:hypothetical protein